MAAFKRVVCDVRARLRNPVLAVGVDVFNEAYRIFSSDASPSRSNVKTVRLTDVATLPRPRVFALSRNEGPNVGTVRTGRLVRGSLA
jgi:dihydroorotate dehydrogenase